MNSNRKGLTRAEARRASLEKQIGTISLRIAEQQISAVPFVNSLAAQIKANDRIKVLNERLKPLQSELRELERQASAETTAARAELAKQKGRRR